MPDSKKKTRTVTPSRRTRQWETDLTEGPQTLYSHFVAHALDERMPEIDNLDDATRDILFDAVEIAIKVVCAAADIAPNWEGFYHQVNARVA